MAVRWTSCIAKECLCTPKRLESSLPLPLPRRLSLRRLTFSGGWVGRHVLVTPTIPYPTRHPRTLSRALVTGVGGGASKRTETALADGEDFRPNFVGSAADMMILSIVCHPMTGQWKSLVCCPLLWSGLCAAMWVSYSDLLPSPRAGEGEMNWRCLLDAQEDMGSSWQRLPGRDKERPPPPKLKAYTIDGCKFTESSQL